MANLYGVANAPGLPSLAANSTADVNCPSGATTPVIVTAPLIAPSNGYFYAMLWAQLEITMGATVPASIYCGAAIGAGSFVNNFGYATGGFAANGTYYLPFYTFTTPSQTAWQGAGSTVSMGVIPGGQAIVVRQYSYMMATLFRAPDQ